MMVLEYKETLLFSEIEIPVIATKNIKLSLGGLELSLKKGAKINLPVRVALPLLQNKTVEVNVDDLMKFSLLNKTRWREERTDDLQKLDEGFYYKTMLYFSFLHKQANEGDTNAETLLKKARILIQDILRTRMNKIVKLALANPVPSREIMVKMTREERFLYLRLCRELHDWFEGMVKFIEEVEEL